MEVDEAGNIKPDPAKIAELQRKQEREEQEKKEYMRYLERSMDLWCGIQRKLTQYKID